VKKGQAAQEQVVIFGATALVIVDLMNTVFYSELKLTAPDHAKQLVPVAPPFVGGFASYR